MTRYVSPLVLLLGLTSCGSPTPPQVRDDTCPQTYEFGNSGCARLVVLPGSLPADVPTPYRWDVRAKGEGVEEFAAGRNPLPGEVQLQLISMAPPWLGDTMTVTVMAQAREDSGPVVVGVPLPLIAIDSVQLTVRFVPVGERPYVDTVRLNIERVDAP